MQPSTNSLLAKHAIELGGEKFSFCWDFGALISYAELPEAEKKSPTPDGTVLKALRNMVWAGCRRAAEERGISWTLAEVELRLPLEAAGRDSLWTEIQKAVVAEHPQGESGPAAEGSSAPAGKRVVRGGRKR